MNPLDKIGDLLLNAANLTDDFIGEHATARNRLRAATLVAAIDSALIALRRLEHTQADEQLRDEADERRLSEALGK